MSGVVKTFNDRASEAGLMVRSKEKLFDYAVAEINDLRAALAAKTEGVATAVEPTAAAWIDQFGNVFPLGAYSIDGKPNYHDQHKRGWKPLGHIVPVDTLVVAYLNEWKHGTRHNLTFGKMSATDCFKQNATSEYADLVETPLGRILPAATVAVPTNGLFTANGLIACANCLRPHCEHSGKLCPSPFTTHWHAWDYKAPQPHYSEYDAPSPNDAAPAVQQGGYAALMNAFRCARLSHEDYFRVKAYLPYQPAAAHPLMGGKSEEITDAMRDSGAEVIYGHPRHIAQKWAKEDKFDSAAWQAEQVYKAMRIAATKGAAKD